jgi:hypothetical protein
MTARSASVRSTASPAFSGHDAGRSSRLRGDRRQGPVEPSLRLGDAPGPGVGDRGEQAGERIGKAQPGRLVQLDQRLVGPVGSEQDTGAHHQRFAAHLADLVRRRVQPGDPGQGRVDQRERPGIVVDGARGQADRPARGDRVVGPTTRPGPPFLTSVSNYLLNGLASQTFAVPSKPPVTIRDPSGLNVADRTSSVCPLSVRTAAPL